MIRIKWPIALATLFVVLLGSYVIYARRIVDEMRQDAETLTQIFARVNDALTDTILGNELLLFDLQGIVIGTDVPMVVTGPRNGPAGGDSVLSVVNLRFEADLETSEGQASILAEVDRMDARYPPVGNATQLVHFGDTPVIRLLVVVPWLVTIGLLLTVAVGASFTRAR